MDYNNKTLQLIDQLSEDLRPTKRKSWKLPCISWCIIIISLIIINYFFVSDLFVNSKNSLLKMLLNPIFILGLQTSLFSFLFSIFASLPGRNFILWKYISFFSFIVWGVVILFEMAIQNELNFDLKEFYHCGSGTFISTVLFFIILFYFIKKRFILDFQSAILGGILASSSSGTLCLGFICQNEKPSHIFYSHFLPILVLFLLAYGIFSILHKLFGTHQQENSKL